MMPSLIFNSEANSSPLEAVEISLRRLRLMGAVVVIGAGVAQRGDSANRLMYLAAFAIVGALLTANAASKRMESRDDGFGRLVLVQLVLDVAATTVAIIVFATDSTSMAWVVIGLPVLEGAMRYRVLGAFAAWLAITSALCIRVIVVWTPGSGLEPFLELAQPLSLGLALGIPAGYVAEHLTAEIIYAASENDDMQRRSRLLAVLAIAGQDLAGSGQRQVMATAVEAAKELGFSAADLGVIDTESGEWQRSFACSEPDEFELEPSTAESDLASAERGAMVRSGDRVAGLLAREGRNALVLRAIDRSESPSWAPRDEAFSVLSANVATAIAMAVRQEQLRAEQQRLKYEATHDHLTGLLNRAGLLSEFETMFAGDTDELAGSVVLFLDLDSFKQVNDSYGHDAGDIVLKEVATRLRGHLPADALVGRMGGDEFVVVVSGCGASEAKNLREKIDRVIAEPMDVGGRHLRVGSSTGMHAIGDSGASPEQALRIADADMYERKRTRQIGSDTSEDLDSLAETASGLGANNP